MTETIKVTLSGLDAAAGYAKVTLSKSKEFALPQTQAEAQEMLGGSAEKLLAVIQAGMRGIFRDQLAEDNEVAWQDDNGDDFAGTLLSGESEDRFRAHVLSLAKNKIGAKWSDLSADEKRAAKSDAQAVVLAHPEIFSF